MIADWIETDRILDTLYKKYNIPIKNKQMRDIVFYTVEHIYTLLSKNDMFEIENFGHFVIGWEPTAQLKFIKFIKDKTFVNMLDLHYKRYRLPFKPKNKFKIKKIKRRSV